MIKRFRNTETIKCYSGTNRPENHDEYSGIISISWIGSYVAYIHSANGCDGYSNLIEIVKNLKDDGARIIMAIRCKNHKMPKPWKVVETIFDETIWELRIGE